MFPEVFYQRALLTHFRARGFQVREELGYGRRRFDAVAFDGDAMIGIEVKTRDWRRALRQASYHRLCFEYAYIALPIKAVTVQALSSAKDLEIGVLSIGEPPLWEISVVLEAPQSNFVVEQHSEAVKMIARFVR